MRLASTLALILSLGTWLGGNAFAGAVAIPPAADATLIENADGSAGNGSGPAFFAGRTNQSQSSMRRGLIAFDIAGHVPPKSTVTRVSLILHHTGGNPVSATVKLHLLRDSWGEGPSSASGGSGSSAAPGDATWLHRLHNPADAGASLAWTRPGGDFEMRPRAARTVGGAGYYTWDTPRMARDVQRWLEQPSDNHGWILIGDESAGGTSKRFDSRESGDAMLRPVLLVEFVAPRP